VLSPSSPRWRADLSNGLAKSLSLPLTGILIEGIWHTSIVLRGVETYYGQGILQTSPPGSTHHGRPLKVVDLGETELDHETFAEYLDELRDHYRADKVRGGPCEGLGCVREADLSARSRARSIICSVRRRVSAGSSAACGLADRCLTMRSACARLQREPAMSCMLVCIQSKLTLTDRCSATRSQPTSPPS
jgi:hypothetical protein